MVALTGTGLGSSICYPPSIGCPARPLGSAVQPSVPPLCPPPLAAQSLAWPGLPCPPPSATLVGCLDLHWKVGVRSEGESCQDSELIRKGISGAYWHCVLQKRKLKTEDGGEYRDHRRSANRGGAGGPDHLLAFHFHALGKEMATHSSAKKRILRKRGNRAGVQLSRGGSRGGPSHCLAGKQGTALVSPGTQHLTWGPGTAAPPTPLKTGSRPT